jgi:hypothetical protein
MEEGRPTRRDPEPPPADLQLQFEQVSLALEQLRQTQDRLHDMETRLAEMTADCAGILDRWAKNDERHAAAVVELHGRLSEWNDLERKLLSESATRVHQFERSLAHEWNAIRQTHEEPIHRIDAQAARITEACVTAVDAALKKFDAAEARFAALEQQVSREMSELSREVREALAEMRHAPQIGPARPWSLDNVVRLHNELRAEAHDTGDVLVADGPHGSIPASLAAAPAHVVAPSPAEAPAPPARVLDAEAPAAPAPARSSLRSACLIAAVVIVLLGAYALYLRSSVAEGLRAAAARAEAAERGVQQTRDAAAQQLAAVERAATARIASAQEAATAAQVTTRILAAPDQIRFDLAGGAPGRRAAAQVLWSRAEGVAIHGSGLQAAPAGQAYQLWLLTPTTATSAGVFTPDAAGRVASTFGPPAALPRPVVAARVTLEPADGSAAPAGRTALAAPDGARAAPARTAQSGT